MAQTGKPNGGTPAEAGLRRAGPATPDNPPPEALRPARQNAGSAEPGEAAAAQADSRDALARIARMISIGDDPAPAADAAPHGGTAAEAEPRRDAARQEQPANDAPALAELTSTQLLEALPAGLAVCAGVRLVTANAAFALAFGYRSAQQLEDAGGFAAIFPGTNGELEKQLARAAGTPSKPVELRARSCSGRSFRVPVAAHPISSGTAEKASLIVLHPHGSVFAEPRTNLSSGTAAGAAPDSAPSASSGGGSGKPVKDTKKKRKDQGGNRHKANSGGTLARTDFLTKVSHELRTPLNSIIGFAEIMKDEQLGPIGNDRYRGYVRDILDSGVYALSLVNDLLDISKIEAGEFELNFTAVDLDEVIAESVHSMQPQAQRQRVLLRTAFAEGLPPVLADRRSIRQIILNLVSNAIKFTRPGGQVIVSTQRTGSGGVRIRVRDTGIGMSKSEVVQAMKPFRQLDTPMPRQPGTGLGLPLTKALVEANRARFKLRSVSDAGTRIDVTFPNERVAGGGD